MRGPLALVIALASLLCHISRAQDTANVVAPRACPAGSHGPGDGTCTPCPAGTFCPEGAALAQPCPVGYYCATPLEKHECRTPGSYCPEGSLAEAPCPSGFACSTPLHRESCESAELCPPGTTEQPRAPGRAACRR